jgi:hypothetical protein
MAPKKQKSAKKARKLKSRILASNKALTKVFSYRATAKDKDVA